MDSNMTNKYPHIQIREYLESDYEYFCKYLRDADKKELEALFDFDYKEGLEYSIENTDELWVATYKGKPVVIFGITIEDLDGMKSGLVWAVGTYKTKFLGRELVAIGKKVIDRWLDDYDLLFNFIWEDNKNHIKWLESMGFVLEYDKTILSPSEENFIFFSQSKK